MTQLIEHIADIADQFDAIVLDQWGVLHDGTSPYPKAITALEQLDKMDVKLAVLSNSGKRAEPNARRIETMGFETKHFTSVMTSGEALWLRFASGVASETALFAIEGRAGDAQNWAEGLSIKIVTNIDDADAVVLMGLPDGTAIDGYDRALQAAHARGLPLYCSNPDFKSPRGGGTFVMSPGALAQRYSDMGGTVHLFGKPHLPIFTALQDGLGCAAERILMVGDSLHHDVAGAQTAGWASLFIRCGVHAPDIRPDHVTPDIAALTQSYDMPMPDFTMFDLR